MSTAISENARPGVRPGRTETKAETTDRAARAIIAAEAARNVAKTERLRRQRLERAALTTAGTEQTTKRRKNAGSGSR